MNDIDKKIQEALSSAHKDGEFNSEPNITEELIKTFQGRHKITLLIALIVSTIIFAVSIWAGFQFFKAETTQMQLRWGGLCLVTLLMVSFVKVYFWLEMHSNRLMRELKRLELLISSTSTNK